MDRDWTVYNGGRSVHTLTPQERLERDARKGLVLVAVLFALGVWLYLQ